MTEVATGEDSDYEYDFPETLQNMASTFEKLCMRYEELLNMEYLSTPSCPEELLLAWMRFYGRQTVSQIRYERVDELREGVKKLFSTVPRCSRTRNITDEENIYFDFSNYVYDKNILTLISQYEAFLNLNYLASTECPEFLKGLVFDHTSYRRTMFPSRYQGEFDTIQNGINNFFRDIPSEKKYLLKDLDLTFKFVAHHLNSPKIPYYRNKNKNKV